MPPSRLISQEALLKRVIRLEADRVAALGQDGTDGVAGAGETAEQCPALTHVDCVASLPRPGT